MCQGIRFSVDNRARSVLMLVHKLTKTFYDTCASACILYVYSPDAWQKMNNSNGIRGLAGRHGTVQRNKHTCEQIYNEFTESSKRNVRVSEQVIDGPSEIRRLIRGTYWNEVVREKIRIILTHSVANKLYKWMQNNNDNNNKKTHTYAGTLYTK